MPSDQFDRPVAIMDHSDQLRLAIHDVLISGVSTDTKIEQLIGVLGTHRHCFSPVIVGWLDVYVRAPEVNEYIDVRWPDATIAYERLCTVDLLKTIRQRGALWKPAIH